jgi:hypothetical protein
VQWLVERLPYLFTTRANMIYRRYFEIAPALKGIKSAGENVHRI